MDWITLNVPSVFIQFMFCFPPVVLIGRVCTICTHPLDNCSSLCRILLIYCLGSLESVRTTTMSSTTNHHSFLNQVFLIFFPSKTDILLLSIASPQTYSRIYWFKYLVRI